MRLLRAVALSVIAVASSMPAVSVEDPEWVVFTSTKASAFTQPCSRAFPPDLSGAWDPQAADIARAERRFEAAVEEAFLKLPAEYREPRPKKYYRQYAGFLRSGERVLYVNAVAADDEIAAGTADALCPPQSLRATTTHSGSASGGDRSTNSAGA